MLDLRKTIEDMQEIAKSANSALTALPTGGAQSTHFWKAQDTFLTEFEAFSSAWFKRRHTATRTAIETSKRLAEEAVANPTAAMSILSDWQKHSMERLAEDTKDCMEMMTRCASAAVTNEVEAVEETVESAKRATKAAKSMPV
jgi:hypothetical protein